MPKPSPKFLIVFNVVANLPMAIAMSVTAPILMGQEIFNVHTLLMILLGFVLATLINVIIPVQKVNDAFAGIFKLNKDSIAAKFVGNIPVCLIFVVIIGLIITAINVRVFPAIIFAFLGTFIPLYIVCYIVSMIFVPLALKAAMATN